MEIVSGIGRLPLPDQPCVVTVGFFDGVHLGHQAVFARTVEEAEARDIPSVAVTFDRHPREILTPGSEPRLLTTVERRARLIERTGIDTLVVLAFMYKQSSPNARLQIASLALICGGAVGNLIDRIRSPRGVVDFIDIGMGAHRFWTFNVADMAVTIGTAILTWILCMRATSDEPRSHTLPTAGALDEPN